MNHMDMSNSSSSSISNSSSGIAMGMSMGTFHWSSTGDALWFDTWIPKSESGYIGACFGLLFLTIVSRGLLALEICYAYWIKNRFQQIHGHDDDSAEARQPFLSSEHGISTANVNTDITRQPISSTYISSSSNHNGFRNYPKPLSLPRVTPFSWPIDTTRSFLMTITIFINYMLMLVVMTGNGGFFIVIIVGFFIGEIFFGCIRSLDSLRTDHRH